MMRRIANVILSQRRLWMTQPGSLHGILTRAKSTAKKRITILDQLSHSKAKIDPKHIIKSPGPDIEIPLMPLDEFVWKNVSKWPDKIALECGLTGRKYTFEEAKSLTHKFAQGLHNLGFKKGDVIAVVVTNIPEHPIVVLGAIRAGLQVTLVNPICTEYEISAQLTFCKPAAIVTTRREFTKAKAASSKCRRLKNFIVIGDSKSNFSVNDPDIINFEDLINWKHESESDVTFNANFDAKQNVALLPFSSGTSGIPKGVMLTHANLISNIIAMGHPQWVRARETTDTHQECFIVVVPLSHIYGLNAILLGGLAYGCKIVILPKFDPNTYIGAIAKHQPTILHTIPTIMDFLLETNAIENKMCQRVHTVVSGGSPPGPLLIKKMLTKFEEIGMNDVAFQEGYGMTETSPLITLLKPCTLEKKHLFGSCGKPIPGAECVIINPEGFSVGVGEHGELYARGPQIMKGYLNNEMATHDIMDGDWIITGDAAKIDPSGFIFIVERLKELIKVKGYSVSPTEIENVLKDHPNVADVGVCGFLDPKYGEIPRAFVVLIDPSFTKEEEIVNFLQEKLSKHKQLRGGVQFVTEIPRNANGKIMRKELKALYRQKRAVRKSRNTVLNPIPEMI